jgi:hypothetical protein
MYNADKIKTEKDAIAYLKKVLEWHEFIESHKKLKQSLEILLAKIESESQTNE